MSRADSSDSTQFQEVHSTLKGSDKALGPSLSFEGDGNGYLRAEELEDCSSIFSRPVRSLEEYDSRTDENIVIDAERSAKLLESYLGQHSRSEESLSEFLDDYVIEEPDLDSNFVMELDLMDYDGKQHLDYNGGRVAREVIEYLESESAWSSQVYFMEEQEKVFIQSNP